MKLEAKLGDMKLFSGLLHLAAAAAAGAATPRAPRGWNSFDAFVGSVNETQFLGNCRALARDLLPYGYDHCVVDYLWYDDADGTQNVDANGRLQPSLERWPSAAGGRGFGPVAAELYHGRRRGS